MRVPSFGPGHVRLKGESRAGGGEGSELARPPTEQGRLQDGATRPMNGTKRSLAQL
jgi:hypothetical protein